MTSRRILIVTLLLLAGSLAVGIPLHRMNAEHRAKYGSAFTELQDAREIGKAKEILRDWKWTGATEEIKRAMQLDLAFPLFYATLLALLAWMASLSRPTSWVARLGRVIAFFALFGGLADVAENVTLLTMLNDPEASRFPIMLVFTYVKIAGILAGLLYLLFSHLDVNAPRATASDVLPDT